VANPAARSGTEPATSTAGSVPEAPAARPPARSASPGPASGTGTATPAASATATAASRNPAPDRAAAAPGRRAAPAPAAGEVRWSDVASRLDIAGPVRELARNITLDSVEGERWRFLIPSHLAHLSSRKLLDRLGSALAEEVGGAVDVTLVPADGTVETPAAAAERARQDSRSDAERAIADDPTVRAMRETFGAVVDPDSIQPLQ